MNHTAEISQELGIRLTGRIKYNKKDNMAKGHNTISF